VPTASFRLLFVLVVLAHNRRRLIHVAVTEHPTAAWTAQQLRNAFPENDAPRYLLHDRDSVFTEVATTIAAMNTQAVSVRTAPRSPWQNAYAERAIGSIRRVYSPRIHARACQLPNTALAASCWSHGIIDTRASNVARSRR
jgi:putative transposase